MSNPIRILQVSTSDVRGGAQKIAYHLNSEYRKRGYSAWLSVGYKYSDDPYVINIPNEVVSNFWASLGLKIEKIASSSLGDSKYLQDFGNILRLIGQPYRLLEILKGHEDFDFSGTWKILELLPQKPDILHCHNLHGKYFDLRALPWISRQVSVVLTLHDQWMLSGHCSHSFDCERWKTGCGQCPDLTIYPAIWRDATDYNWQRKREIYAKSCLYIATPSRWLMEKVEQSIIAPAILESRVIPNGVDLSAFHPLDKMAARSKLGISKDAKVLLFAAQDITRNVFKDYQTVSAAVAKVAECLNVRNLLFIALGADAKAEPIAKAEVNFIPFQNDPEVVALYYQSADLYIHAANADNFPNTILEALCCGTPVVATAVGGIPEQIKPLQSYVSGLKTRSLQFKHYSIDGATGILVPQKDPDSMAEAILYLLNNEKLLTQLGENAADDARKRFDLEKQVRTYLEWYEDIIAKENTNSNSPSFIYSKSTYE